MWVSSPSEMLGRMCREGSGEVKGCVCLVAEQEKGKPGPCHTASATTLEHDSYRPGARSTLPDGESRHVRFPICQDEGGELLQVPLLPLGALQ